MRIMPRRTRFRSPKRTNILIETDLHKVATDYAHNEDISGGFGGLVSKLLRKHLKLRKPAFRRRSS